MKPCNDMQDPAQSRPHAEPFGVDCVVILVRGLKYKHLPFDLLVRFV